MHFFNKTVAWLLRVARHKRTNLLGTFEKVIVDVEEWWALLPSILPLILRWLENNFLYSWYNLPHITTNTCLNQLISQIMPFFSSRMTQRARFVSYKKAPSIITSPSAMPVQKVWVTLSACPKKPIGQIMLYFSVEAEFWNLARLAGIFPRFHFTGGEPRSAPTLSLPHLQPNTVPDSNQTTFCI